MTTINKNKSPKQAQRNDIVDADILDVTRRKTQSKYIVDSPTKVSCSYRCERKRTDSDADSKQQVLKVAVFNETTVKNSNQTVTFKPLS